MSLKVAIGHAQALNGREASLQATHYALNSLGSANPSMGYVIASHQYQARDVVSGASSLLGDTPLIGLSSSVGFSSKGLHPNSVVVALMNGNLQAETHWMPGYAQSGRETGSRLAKQLEGKEDARALLFFADGFNGDADQLCPTLLTGNVTLAGGLSSEDLHTGHSYQLAGPQTGTGALAGAILRGDLRVGISGRVFPGNKILDAGSGFGNMSKTALRLCDGNISITLYDPLVPMLKNTGTHFEKTPDLVNGVFEHIPFKEGEFDAVLCGYSLRDAINLRIAISEIHRVLKNNGRFVIVDLGKPDEMIIRLGVSFYLRFILPILALIAGGRLGLKFGTLYGTYKRWPQNKKLEKLLLEKFSKVEFEKDLMGGAIMVAAYK